MEYYQTGAEVPTSCDPVGPFSRPMSPEISPADGSMVDSITSLITLAENMDFLLPPDISLNEQYDIDVPDISTSNLEGTNFTIDDFSGDNYRPCSTLPTMKNDVRHNLKQDYTQAISKVIPGFVQTIRKPTTNHPQCSSTTASQVSYPMEKETSQIGAIEMERNMNCQSSIMTNGMNNMNNCNMKRNIPSSLNMEQQSTVTSNSIYPNTENTSPCSIRELNPFRNSMNSTPNMMQKIQKTTRKPKTYSKPVASRFCHICSRMPRRGQGSLTCRRMGEGLCRKIVCEQCLREQGWCYEEIIKNPSTWLCPHCADVCPPRSQCHIYNRINARRKKVGSQNKVASLPTALASSDLLLGPYSHLFGQHQNQSTNFQQILQPPPNFKLNLPPSYTQL